MDLEKLVWTPSISAQLPATFDLLWAKPLENLVFRPQSQGGKIPDFQTPPAPPADKFSDPNLTPLPTHPGIKYVARTLAAIIVVGVEWVVIIIDAIITSMAGADTAAPHFHYHFCQCASAWGADFTAVDMFGISSSSSTHSYEAWATQALSPM